MKNIAFRKWKKEKWKKVKYAFLWVSALLTTALCIVGIFNADIAFAGNLQGSDFYKGTEKLLKDLSTAVLILAPIVTVLVVTYFFIRKGAADEMDSRKWQNRIITAIICGIGAVTAAALINMLGSYYGASF